MKISLVILMVGFLPSFSHAIELTPKQKEKIRHWKQIDKELESKTAKEFEGKSNNELMDILKMGSGIAASILIKRNAVSVNKTVDIMIKGLTDQLKNPPIPPAWSNTPPESHLGLRANAFAVHFSYIGKQAIPSLKSHIKGKSKKDNFVQWIILGLCYAGDTKSIEDLLEMSVTSTNPYVRRYAVKAVLDAELYTHLTKQKLLSYLKKWVHDPFFMDIPYEHGSSIVVRNYPIREEAITILLFLDIKFERKNGKSFEITIHE